VGTTFEDLRLQVGHEACIGRPGLNRPTLTGRTVPVGLPRAVVGAAPLLPRQHDQREHQRIEDEADADLEAAREADVALVHHRWRVKLTGPELQRTVPWSPRRASPA